MRSGKRLIFKWDDELRAVIETIKQIKPHRIGDSHTLLEASERLGHSDTGITQRVYRRKPIVIEPLKRA